MSCCSVFVIKHCNQLLSFEEPLSLLQLAEDLQLPMRALRAVSTSRAVIIAGYLINGGGTFLH